jgi:hypothetical protein
LCSDVNEIDLSLLEHISREIKHLIPNNNVSEENMRR